MKKRILYFAPIQGPLVVDKRKIVVNYNIAANPKIRSICKALDLLGHEITICSPGTVGENRNRLYRSFSEQIEIKRDELRIIADYLATYDNRYLKTFVEVTSCLIIVPRILKKKCADTVIVYNISLLSIVVSILGKVNDCEVYLEYEDSPKSVRVKRSSLFIILKSLYKKLYSPVEAIYGKYLLDGAIAVNMDLARSIKNRNYICIPGVVPDDGLKKKSAKNANLNGIKMIYSGGLSEDKGILNFIKAIEDCKYRFELHIFGKGPQSEIIREYCDKRKDKYIFHGFVTREILLSTMESCDVGINPHSCEMDKGGFLPFKLVEYLSVCGSVISSNSSGIPKELKNNIYLYEEKSKRELLNAFEKFIIEWPEYRKEKEQRIEWAYSNYSTEAISRKLDSLFRQAVLK